MTIKITYSFMPIKIMSASKVKKYSLLWPAVPLWKIYYHCSFGQSSTSYSNATDVAQWAAPSSRRPQPATYNGVRDDQCVLPFTGQYS